MRICVVSDQAFPAQGGEGIATQNLCIRLARRGHRVLFLTSKVPHPPRMKENIEVVRFPGVGFFQKGYFALTSAHRIVPIFEQTRPQIVHVNLPTLLGWQSFLAAEKLSIPKVSGFHVQVGNVVPYEVFPLFCLRYAVELWFSYFYRRADVLLSPSHLGKKILSGYSPDSRIEVVSNGVDVSVFNPHNVSKEKAERFREKFNLGKSSLLLYVGRLSREKNVFYLLEVMKILNSKYPSIKLLVVGRGELTGLFLRRAQAVGVEGSVVFAGFVSSEDLLCAYREADIFILPSLYELQSIVTLEAMAMGCAVLIGGSDQSAACELVEEGVNGYIFDLDNPHHAAQKILLVLSNPDLKRSMQQGSLRMAGEHHIEKSVSRVEKLYGEFIGNGA